MSMNKPPIDDLLEHIPSYYEVTVAAAMRATDIKRANREHIQPLQTAVTEIADGKIEVMYAAETPEQGELPLGADVTDRLLNPTNYEQPTHTPLPAGAIEG